MAPSGVLLAACLAFEAYCPLCAPVMIVPDALHKWTLLQRLMRLRAPTPQNPGIQYPRVYLNLAPLLPQRATRRQVGFRDNTDCRGMQNSLCSTFVPASCPFFVVISAASPPPPQHIHNDPTTTYRLGGGGCRHILVRQNLVGGKCGTKILSPSAVHLEERLTVRQSFS